MPDQDDHGFSEWAKRLECGAAVSIEEALREGYARGESAGVRRGLEEMREEAVKYCEKGAARWLHKAGLSPENSAAHLASECAYEDAADAIRNIQTDPACPRCGRTGVHTCRGGES
jgi:hypothetical protein